MIRKTLSFALIVLLILMSSSFVAAQPEEGYQELKIAIHGDENTLTPFTYVRGYPGLEVLRLVFDSLFIMDEENRPHPWMVDRYDINEKFTEYRVTLHPGQFWHDGRAVTADDVAFSFVYPLTQNSTRWRRIALQVETVEVSGEYDLVIRLKNANPDFLAQALTDMPIIPKHIYEDQEDATQVGETIGSGPYKLLEYKSGQHYIFEAVTGYFKGAPRVMRLVMPIMTDTTTIFQALKSGSIDAATANVPPELVVSFSEEKNVEVVAGPGLSTTLLQFNSQSYPFTLLEMRKAVVLALDLQELVDVVLLGYGDPGSMGFFHPAGTYGKHELVPKRDLVKSNELLDSLGFARQADIRIDGEGKKLSFELLVYANNALRIRTAELIAEQLKDVGIEIKVVSLESATLDDLVWPGFDVSQGRNYVLSLWGWSAPVQLRPDALVQLYASNFTLGTLNIGGFLSEKFDRLVEQFQNEDDIVKRNTIISEMQTFVADAAPLVPLYHPQVIMAYRPEAYTGWVMQQGNGIINKMSFLPGYSQDISGEELRENTAEKERNTVIPLISLAAVLALFAVVRSRRKKSNA